MRWLEHPEAIEQETVVEAATDRNIGTGRLSQEMRVHVGMDSASRKSYYGALFDTSGLGFTAAGKQARRLSDAQRLALAIAFDESEQQKFLQELPDHDLGARERLSNFGGERRIVRWCRSTKGLPECPDTLKEEISKQGACRLILLTPAYFEHYAYPTWLLSKCPDIEIAPTLQAVAIQRPQIVSGWDIANNRARKTKRLAPAGTVLYLKFAPEYRNSSQLEAWIDKTWMHSVSDDDHDKEENSNPQQFRLDGFGLAALGTWSGEAASMKES
jgi:CRISPR-associated protein Cmr3